MERQFKLMLWGCVIYICCVGFASLDIVCDKLNYCALVCNIFLISVRMFIVSKDLFISSATVIVRAGGAICLNPFATVLVTQCCAVSSSNGDIFRICIESDSIQARRYKYLASL